MVTIKVLIDSSFVGQANGIGVDTSNILSSLSGSETNNYEIEFRKKITSPFLIKGKKFLFTYFGKKTIIKSDNFQVFFQSQVGVGIPSSTSTKWVVRIHDIFPITNPEWFTRSSVRYFRKSLEVALNHGASLLFNSYSTKSEFEKFYPCIENETMVWFCSEQNLQSPLCKECAGCRNIQISRNLKYFLSVGTIEPRKNYLELLQSWKMLPQNFTTNFALVIIGKYGWKARKDRMALQQAKYVNVLWIDNCCSGALNTLYLNAVAFISNGLNEGFDIPALEARNYSRLPLILRDIPVHNEIHPHGAHFFSDRKSLNQLLSKVEELDRPQVIKISNNIRLLEAFFRK